MNRACETTFGHQGQLGSRFRNRGKTRGGRLVLAGLVPPPPYPPPQAGEGREGARRSVQVNGMAETGPAMTKEEPP